MFTCFLQVDLSSIPDDTPLPRDLKLGLPDHSQGKLVDDEFICSEYRSLNGAFVLS